MNSKLLLLFYLFSFYLALNEVKLKSGNIIVSDEDGFKNFDQKIEKIFPKNSTVQGLTSYFQKWKKK